MRRIPLGLGGAPADPRNFWPEPRTSPEGWGADRKDELEFALNQLVCSGVCRCERPSARSRQTGSPPITAMLNHLANPTLRARAHGENPLSPAKRRRGGAVAEQGGGLATPAPTVSLEGGDLGFGRLAADGGGTGDRRLVRFPLLAGDVGVGIDCTLGRRHQRIGGEARFGGELAGAGGA